MVKRVLVGSVDHQEQQDQQDRLDSEGGPDQRVLPANQVQLESEEIPVLKVPRATQVPKLDVASLVLLVWMVRMARMAQPERLAHGVTLECKASVELQVRQDLKASRERRAKRAEMEIVDPRASRVHEDWVVVLVREDPEAVVILGLRGPKVLKGRKETRDHQGLVLVDLQDPWVARVKQVLLEFPARKAMPVRQDLKAFLEKQEHKEIVVSQERWAVKVFVVHREMLESKDSKVIKVQ